MLGGAEGPHVRLEDRVLAFPQRLVGAVRERPDDLRLDLADLGGEGGLRQQIPRRTVPAQPKMLCDVGNRRPLDAHGSVVPADPAPRHMRRRIPGVTAVERQVDAAYEGDPVVDHDRLLVVAVRESGAAVGVCLDLRMS